MNKTKGRCKHCCSVLSMRRLRAALYDWSCSLHRKCILFFLAHALALSGRTFPHIVLAKNLWMQRTYLQRGHAKLRTSSSVCGTCPARNNRISSVHFFFELLFVHLIFLHTVHVSQLGANMHGGCEQSLHLVVRWDTWCLLDPLNSFEGFFCSQMLHVSLSHSRHTMYLLFHWLSSYSSLALSLQHFLHLRFSIFGGSCSKPHSRHKMFLIWSVWFLCRQCVLLYSALVFSFLHRAHWCVVGCTTSSLSPVHCLQSVSYTHLTLPTKRIV